MRKITYLLSLLLILGSMEMFAEKEKEPVKKLLTDYISAINSLGTSKKKETVLGLLSEKYTGHTAYVKISGAIIRKTYDKEDISSQLDAIIDDNFDYTLSLDKIVYIIQKKRAGTISALVNFSSSIEHKVAEKGTMLMNLVVNQLDGEWHIVQNNMVRVSEAKDIGDCICYLYAKGNTKYVIETYFPAGVQYESELDFFHISRQGKKHTFKTGKEEFVWDKTTNSIKSEEKEIGEGVSIQDVIEKTVRYKYRESCVNVLFN